jgi:hypothetical protein
MKRLLLLLLIGCAPIPPEVEEARDTIRRTVPAASLHDVTVQEVVRASAPDNRLSLESLLAQRGSQYEACIDWVAKAYPAAYWGLYCHGMSLGGKHR